MAKKNNRKDMVRRITAALEHNPFSFEFVVKEKPRGIVVTWEITEEDMKLITPDETEETSRILFQSSHENDFHTSGV